MADSYLDGLLDTSTTLDSIRQANYEKYKDRFKDSTEDLVNSETFLSLLVAEMTNQDPLEPTSNTEFITQLASFSQLNYARDSSLYSMSNYASSLVGKIVTATKPDGANQITKTGLVESVSKSGNTYNVVIDGVMFDISKVTKIENAGSASSSITSTGLADSIARASGMIGMYATAKTEDGVSVGWIDSIKVVEGKITAVLVDENGETIGEYGIDSFTEITYAVINYDPSEPEEPDVSAEPEKTETSKEPVEDIENDPVFDNNTGKEEENNAPVDNIDDVPAAGDYNSQDVTIDGGIFET